MGKMNNKGIFFTFIAITMMAVFLLVFTPKADISLQKNTQAIDTRISVVDNYISDLENRYFETVLRASTYKAILSLVYYLNTTGSYLSNFDASFSEVMMTGKINGVAIDSITGKKIMENKPTLKEVSKIKGINSIVLFGSYAKLIHTEKSDIDIAIILENKIKNRHKIENIIKKEISKISKKNQKEIQSHFFMQKELKVEKTDPLINDIINLLWRKNLSVIGNIGSQSF